MSEVFVVKGKNLVERSLKVLELINPKPSEKTILIKPNLVEPFSKDSGAVTRPEVVEGIVKFFEGNDYEIVIGEGAAVEDTNQCFEKAGYYEIFSKHDVKLVDLNKGPFIKVKLNGKVLKEIEVAKIVLKSYLISVPVLKEHAFEVTLGLKNLMGILKPKNGYPTKSYFHAEGDYKVWAERMVDLATKIKPSLTLIDGTTGMFGSHLFGKLEKFDLTIGSKDVIAADWIGSLFLKKQEVYYLKLALERGIGTYPSKIHVIQIS